MQTTTLPGALPVGARLVYGRPQTVPRFTIAIPTYNRPELLRFAIASAVKQTEFGDCEIIVTDNGSNIETLKVIQEWSEDVIAYYRNEKNLGMVGNWNRGIALSRGKWVTILHDDDELADDYLQLVRGQLSDSCAFACCQCIVGPTPPVEWRRSGAGVVRVVRPVEFLMGPITPFPGVLFNREKAISVGGFDESWYPLADYEFWWRLSLAGEVRMLRVPAAYYRTSEVQTSNTVFPEIIRRSHDLRLHIVKTLALPKLPGWCAAHFASNMLKSGYRKSTASTPLVRWAYRIQFRASWLCCGILKRVLLWGAPKRTKRALAEASA